MYPRASKDEQYFANLNGKRPPVPGREDDYDLQRRGQENKKYPHLDRHQQQAQLNMYTPLKSSKCTKDNPARVCQDLIISRFQNSNARQFDPNKFFKRLEPIITPKVRENGVGETCDETSKVISHERSLSTSTSAHEKMVLLNSGYSRDHPRCCADDEVVCFESYITPKSNSPTTCLRWTEGLNSLLGDAEGLDLFRHFLQSESSESLKILNFVFSCRGFQLMNESKWEKLVEVAKLIHKRYILKEAGARLDPEIKKLVMDRIKKIKELPDIQLSDKLVLSIKDIFNEALREAEQFLEREIYPQFLKSDDFLNYFQRETEMMFNNNNNSNSQINNNCSSPSNKDVIKETHDSDNPTGSFLAPDNSASNCEEKDVDWSDGGRKPPPSPKMDEPYPATYGPVLPSLPEEKELELNYEPKSSSWDKGSASLLHGSAAVGHLPPPPPPPAAASAVSVLQLSSSSLMATRKVRQKHVENLPANQTRCVNDCGVPSATKLSNPYHVTYAPGSAQDSELQSLSSDALTEDTLSFTDSSLDDRWDFHASSRSFSMAAHKKHVRYIRNFAAKNHEANFPGRFIPRTDCVPPDCNLATTSPQAFASMLIGKLQVVKENQEKMERLVRIMQGLQITENSSSAKDPSVLYNHHHHHHYHHHPPRNNHCKSKFKQSQGHQSGKHGLPLMSSDDLTLYSAGDSEDPDNAQSILDDHVSQMWNSFGNSPNQFNSGLVTPEGAKLKVDACSSFHCVHCLPSDSCNNFENFNQCCCDSSDFQKSSVHHHHIPDASMVGSTLDYDKIPHVAMTKSQMHSICAGGGYGISALCNTQKNRGSTRIPGINNCHPSIVSNARDVNTQVVYKTNLGDQTQSGTSDVLVGLSSSRQSNLCDTFGQTRTKRHPFSPESKDRSTVVRCGQEKLANKIQSNNSAFNRHVQINQKRQQAHGNYLDLSLPDSVTTVKGRQPDRKVDSSKAELSSPNSKMTSVMCKASPSTANHLVQNVKCPRSKSLDRQKILSTNGNSCFSHALQNSAFLECKPSGNKADNHRRAMKENIDTPKHRPISTRPHPGNSKVNVQLPGSATERLPLLQSTKKAEAPKECTVVGYYMQNELIPYRITLPGKDITLGQLKVAISKKDNFRFFFKKSCPDFDTDVVHEEVSSDDHILPLWEGKVVCRIEKID